MLLNHTALLLLVAGIVGCAPPPVDQSAPNKAPTAAETSAKTYSEPSAVDHTTASPTDKPTGVLKWASSKEDGLIAARKSGGYVVLVFSTAWSAPCQVMKHEVFDNPGIAKNLENAVLVQVNVDEKRGKALMKEYGVPSIPVLVFLKPDSKPFGRIVGYMTLEGFQHDLDRVLRDR